MMRNEEAARNWHMLLKNGVVTTAAVATQDIEMIKQHHRRHGASQLRMTRVRSAGSMAIMQYLRQLCKVLIMKWSAVAGKDTSGSSDAIRGPSGQREPKGQLTCDEEERRKYRWIHITSDSNFDAPASTDYQRYDHGSH